MFKGTRYFSTLLPSQRVVSPIRRPPSPVPRSLLPQAFLFYIYYEYGISAGALPVVARRECMAPDQVPPLHAPATPRTRSTLLSGRSEIGFRSFSNTVLYTLRRRVLRVYILSSPLPQNHRPQIARQAPPAIQCNSRSRRRSRAKFHLYSSPPR